MTKRRLLPIILIIVTASVLAALYYSRPKADKRFKPPSSQVAVEVIPIETTPFAPLIRSYGRVEPRTKSKVVAQVSGRIIYASEAFRDGGFFKKGAVLLRIEPADYEIDVQVAEANLIEAERRLDEEIARAAQAREDWTRLGQEGEPSPLVLREPQMKAAEANLKSTQARLRQATLNLSRTRIVAPFEGRVLSTNVDLGQVIPNNTQLGEIYASDAVEIRLPIKSNELPLLKLPEEYSHGADRKKDLLDVLIRSELAKEENWHGKIVRTASAIDNSSRQLYVVARVEDPFGKKAEGRFPLKIGQYVTAEMRGEALDNAITIPNNAIYQGSYVYTYRDNAVFRAEINIQWQDSEVAVISHGLTVGEQLVTSPLGKIHSGTAARLISNAPSTPTKTNTKPTKNASANSDNTLPEDWMSRIPPQRLKRMKARAEAEGKSLEEIARDMRAQRKSGGGQQ